MNGLKGEAVTCTERILVRMTSESKTQTHEGTDSRAWVELNVLSLFSQGTFQHDHYINASFFYLSSFPCAFLFIFSPALQHTVQNIKYPQVQAHSWNYSLLPLDFSLHLQTELHHNYTNTWQHGRSVIMLDLGEIDFGTSAQHKGLWRQDVSFIIICSVYYVSFHICTV